MIMFFIMSNRIPCYLRTLRREWGLTQDELADLLPRGTRARVSLVERACKNPNATEVVGYALLFGKGPDAIFPHFREIIEDEVMRRAYRMYRAVEHDDTRAGRRRRRFLRAILVRARKERRRLFRL